MLQKLQHTNKNLAVENSVHPAYFIIVGSSLSRESTTPTPIDEQYGYFLPKRRAC